MESINCSEYQIFLCEDKCCSQNFESRHNYLILSIDSTNDVLGLVQCMSITSMSDKEIGMEVPIKLCNDMISYVVPYNIHSFKHNEFDIKNYKGTIRDTEYCTKEEFIKLLMDIYLDSLGIGAVDHDKVINDYNKYCESFWIKYKDFKEYRDKDVIKEQEEVKVHNVLPNTYSSNLSNTIVSTKKDYSRYNKAYQKITSKAGKGNKTSKKKTIQKKRRDDKRAEKEIEEMMRSCIGSSADTLIEEDNVILENDNTVKELIVPCNNTEIYIESMKKLENLSNDVKEWSDEDLTLFMKGYKKFGFKKVFEVLPNKWKSPSRMSTWFSICKGEAMERQLPPIMALKQINKPISTWKDAEIRYYLAIIYNHKNDANFIIDIVGFDSIDDCDKTTKEVEKESRKRGLNCAKY